MCGGGNEEEGGSFVCCYCYSLHFLECQPCCSSLQRSFQVDFMLEKKILVHGRIASWILQQKLWGLLMMPAHLYWQKRGQGGLTCFPIFINTEVDGTLLINITGHYVERGLQRE